MSNATTTAASSSGDAPAPRLSPLKSALYTAIGHAIAAYIKLVARTTRWTWIGREHWDEALASPRLVAAVWHGRLTPLVMAWPGGAREVVALVSANRDGEYIARMLKPCRIGAVRGSSRHPGKTKDKGGSAAVSALVAAAKAGRIVVVTPDGPRGPIMRAKPGVALVSASADAQIVLVGCSTSPAKIFNSWDRFLLPLPFGRGAIVATPMIAPAAIDDPEALEAKRREIETALYEATCRADAAVGRETPAQGPEYDANAARGARK